MYGAINGSVWGRSPFMETWQTKEDQGANGMREADRSSPLGGSDGTEMFPGEIQTMIPGRDDQSGRVTKMETANQK
jgi:hypothetical protein